MQNQHVRYANKSSERFASVAASISELCGHLRLKGHCLVVNHSVRGYEHFQCTYPLEWQFEYDRNKYHVLDPTIVWALLNTGVSRWSEHKVPDPRGILRKAKRFGLNYGLTYSQSIGAKKTVLFLARSDRDFTDSEVMQIADEWYGVLDTVDRNLAISEAELQIIRRVSQGETYSEISALLGIKETTVKARVHSAKRKLGCKNTAQVIRRLMEDDLI